MVDGMMAMGFRAEVLGRHSRWPVRELAKLLALLRAEPSSILHTHGYKANILGRAARAAGAPIARLVATVHGMNAETRALSLYHGLDRITSPLSDAVAVADARLPPKFPRSARVTYIANGLTDREPFSAAERVAARQRYGLPNDAIVVGLLGRVTAAKGALEVLAAARNCQDPRVLFVFAGDGDLVRVMDVPPNVRFLGYIEDSDTYLPALDIYLQASVMEGLSLALLEAMRGGLPCIATNIGSTNRAIEDGRDGLLIPLRSPVAIGEAVERLVADPAFRSQLAAAARHRFTAEFTLERHYLAYLDLYRSSEKTTVLPPASMPILKG